VILSFQSCCHWSNAVLLFLRRATVINITGILEEIPASNFKAEVSKERKCLEDRRSLRPMGEEEATSVRCPSRQERWTGNMTKMCFCSVSDHFEQNNGHTTHYCALT